MAAAAAGTRSLPDWQALAAIAEAGGYPASQRTTELIRVSERNSGELGPEVLLWRDTFGWCPFCHQIQMHLEEKGVAYCVQRVPLTLYRLGDRDPGLLQDSPDGLVPCLRVLRPLRSSIGGRQPSPAVGHVVRGAHELSEFIEAHFEGPPLLQLWGVNHNLARVYLDLAGVLEQHIHWQLRASLDDAIEGTRTSEAAKAERWLLGTLEDVELALAEASDGPYFFGGSFSVADIAFAPWVDRAMAVLGWLRGVRLCPSRFPAIHRWTAAMQARDSHRSLRLDEETHLRIYAASRPGAVLSLPSLPAGLTVAVHSGIEVAAAKGSSGAEGLTAAEAQAVQCLVACRLGVAALAALRAAAAGPAVLDAMLRAVAAYILGWQASEAIAAIATITGAPVLQAAAPALAAAAAFVRARVAVPRDMSEEAARHLRGALAAVAEELAGPEKAVALMAEELGAYGEKIAFRSRG